MKRLLLCLLAVLPATAAFAENPPKRPNLVFILCDDLGYGDIGVLNQIARKAGGKPAILTPNLDRMAADGIALKGLYCPAPVCAPSRASLFTGVTQGHAKVRDNQFDKALEDNHTVASVLRQAGYATALIGKWGLQGGGRNADSPAGWPAYPTKRGFDFFFGYVRHADGHEHYPKEGIHRGAKQVWDNDREISADLDKCLTTDLFTARAKKWIQDTHAASPDKPFLLMLAFDTPHAVIELPTGPYPAGTGLKGGLQWTGKPGEMISSATGTPDSWIDPVYADARVDGKPWPDVYQRYATSVSRIDACAGDLLGLLRDLELDDNTLVVFTTDNGPSVESYLKEEFSPEFLGGSGPFDGIKRDCWEGGVRVGGIARWPGGIAGGRSTELPMQFQDWLPTFAELAGVPAPARADGVSLVPSLKGAGSQRVPEVYVEYNIGGKTPAFGSILAERRGRQRGQMQLIRLGDFVGVRYDIKSHADPFEIYDILKDPGQRRNLAAEMPELQQRMHDEVLRRRMPDPAAPRPYDKEPVPAAEHSGGDPGLRASVWNGSFPWLPRVEDRKPDSTSVIATPEALAAKAGAALVSGFLTAPADGVYQFAVRSAGASFLRLHEAAVIDGDRGRKPGGAAEGSIILQQGAHGFRLYRGPGSNGEIDSAPLLWKKPGDAEFAPVPASAFSH